MDFIQAGTMMKLSLFVAVTLVLLSGSATAVPLTVVNVAAPGVNCIFHDTCTIVVTDSVGEFTPPGDVGTGRLQSRTSPGMAPAPAGGKMNFEYRVDLTSVSAPAQPNCVTMMRINFGAVVREPYPPGARKHVYVITSGGLGSVGIASATKDGNVVTFSFADGGICPGQTSYFFGLTSATTTPRASGANLFFSQGDFYSVPVRVP